jgi:hypothetical protein
MVSKHLFTDYSEQLFILSRHYISMSYTAYDAGGGITHRKTHLLRLPAGRQAKLSMVGI